MFPSLITATSLIALAVADTSSPLNANGVRLKPQDGEKILVTMQAFKKNDILLIVPSAICLLAHRGGVVRGLQGQTDQLWDEVGDLREPLTDEQITCGRTWDIQLALALLDATAGTGLAGDIWDQYALELPRPEVVTLPFCFNSPELLDQLQCATMKRNAIKQQQRLRNISPEVFSDPLSHRVTAAALQRTLDPSAIPTPLQWAFSMVRSRCFKVAQDWFAIVPVIDMANHSLMPSARFEMFNGNATAAEAPTQGTDNMKADDRDVDITEETVFLLRATRDLQKGEEVTICYDEKYTNERLFVQYGFSLKGNPNDRVFPAEDETASSSTEGAVGSDGSKGEGEKGEVEGGGEEGGKVEEEEVDNGKERAMQLLLSAGDGIAKETNENEDPSTSDAALRVHATMRSLLKYLRASRKQNNGDRSAASHLTGLLTAVEAMSASYPSTLSEDKEVLSSISAYPEPLVTIRGSAISRYSSEGPVSPVTVFTDTTGVVAKGEEGIENGIEGIEKGASLNRSQLMACVRRRIERKELLQCAHMVIKVALILATE